VWTVRATTSGVGERAPANLVSTSTGAAQATTRAVGDPRAAIVDLELTRVNGTLVKVMAWYDNDGASPIR
jgi:hypothetical protein